MLLQELLKYVLNIHWISGRVDIDVKGLTYDYNKVEKDFLYVAVEEYLIHNIWIDGHQYIEEASRRGANSMVIEKDLSIDRHEIGEHKARPYTIVRIGDTKKTLSLMADKFYGYPLRGMKVIGVTGTNGKTTTTHLIKSIFKADGHKPGVVGSIGYFIGDEKQPAIYTTPLSSDLFHVASQMRNQNVDTFIMEASSHGLVLDRTYGIDYDVAVLTNVTRDHLDYHKTVEAYRKAKMLLFQSLGSYDKDQAIGVINADDPACLLFVEATQVSILKYGIQNPADVQGYDLQLGPTGTFFKIRLPQNKRLEVHLKILGLFNVYNALAAVAVGFSQGLDLKAIKEGLERFTSIEGRFEMVDCGQEFPVIVDYAHTPDALETILKTAQGIKTGKLITVFGCGGDKDKGKRPIMGEIGTTLSDYCIITSDNPRTEDPLAIIKEIEAGINRSTACPFKSIVDRREAIEKALSTARSGDVVVLAGKGHEDYQIIGNQKIPFSDKEEVKNFFTRRSSKGEKT
jgi:UDP-N-acetylmuramoyl-L-alanyl-D-glutamate--2,6-diaminopimelate ligase